MTGIYSDKNFDWKKQQSPILSHVQLQGITCVYPTSNLTAHQTSSEGWHFSSSLFGLSTSLPSTLNLGMLGSWHPSLKLLHIFLYLLIIPLHHVENPFSPFLCHFSQVIPSVSPSPGVWHCCTTSHSSITDFVKLKHSSVPPFGKEIYFDYGTHARYDETCMETLSAFLSIRTLFLFVCISSFISVFISSLITTFCLLMTRFYSLLDKFSNWFLVFKTLMVSLFFRFN